VRWLRELQAAGFSPRFLATEQIEAGALQAGTRLQAAPGSQGTASPNQPWQALLLPGSLALTDRELSALRAFSIPSATPPSPSSTPHSALRVPHFPGLVYEGEIGCFDGHGRLRAESAFPARPAITNLAGELHGLVPPALVTPACAAVYRYRLGDARLLGLELLAGEQMGEDLRIQGSSPNTPVDAELTLAAPAHVYDLRTPRYLGHGVRFLLRLEPTQPALLALLDRHVPPDALLDTLAQPAH
jgi:hypothetical protein